MNDFTKEELIEIKRAVDALFEHRDFKDKAATLQFGWKIQSMIDNYCEHKNTSINGAELVCEDCGKAWK